MTIQDTYNTYKVPPFLQQHLYRVAGLAKIITDAQLDEVNPNILIRSALLHSIGYIVEFNMDMFYESWEPEGTAYWSQIKDDMKRRYGADGHRTTMFIVDELRQPPEVRMTIQKTGFRRAAEALEAMDWPTMVLIYCSMRALPTGVGSLDARIKELRERYRYTITSILPKDDREILVNKRALEKIESLIFKHTHKLKPKHLTEEAVQALIPELKNFLIN